MPPISSTRRCSRSRRNTCVTRSASAPPICTAVPSRPAEPPNRCVTTVATSTSGAIRFGTSAARVVNLVDQQVVAARDGLAEAMVDPAGCETGGRQPHSSHGCATRVPVAQSSAIRTGRKPCRPACRAGPRAPAAHIAHGREKIGRSGEEHDFQIRRNIKTWAAETRMDGLRPPDDPGTRRHHQPGEPAVEGRTVRNNAPDTTAGRHAISAGRHCTRRPAPPATWPRHGTARTPRRRQSRSGRAMREISWGAIRSSGRIADAAPIAAAAFGIRDGAGRLVLRDRVAALRAHRLQAERAVAPHARQQHAERLRPASRRRRC